MLDHVSLGVSDLARSRRFYDAALRPLGVVRLLDFEDRGSDYGCMAPPYGTEFTITKENSVSRAAGQHICFRAPDRPAVDAFYAAVLNEGGVCDGEPSVRAQYHEDYYAAFVLDLDGNRIEAVCHVPERNSQD